MFCRECIYYQRDALLLKGTYRGREGVGGIYWWVTLGVGVVVGVGGGGT